MSGNNGFIFKAFGAVVNMDKMLGGKVDMPFHKTFWADNFGMCTDKFGTPWMVNGNLHDPT